MPLSSEFSDKSPLLNASSHPYGIVGIIMFDTLIALFNTFIVQPIFNILTLIYAILPGHNFGLVLIIFTIIVRMALWPLVKKQLHNTKKIRELQPELKKIKQQTKGNRARETELTMALYKEREVNPFSSIGILLLQLPILLALYAGINKVVKDPQQLIDFSYPIIQNLGYMKELAADISKFDFTLFGVIDLSRPALSNGSIYWGAMLLVIGGAAIQYFTSKQLMVTDKNARTLREIMKETAATGEQADQAEVSAAISRIMVYFIPAMIFIFTVNLAAALALYFLVSGIVAYIQQRMILGQDKIELEAAIDKIPIEAEIVSTPEKKKKKSAKRSVNQQRRNGGDRMEESITYAKKYLEDILSFFGLNVDVHATHDDDVIELNVPSTHLNGFLIGQHGDTVRSLQFLVSNALRNKGYEYTRVNVDIADYKKARDERLAEHATKWMNDVKKSGKELALKPMSAAERRVVHQVAADYGLSTESVGQGRDRHIVIKSSSVKEEAPAE